jgi:hypothetical protein
MRRGLWHTERDPIDAAFWISDVTFDHSAQEAHGFLGLCPCERFFPEAHMERTPSRAHYLQYLMGKSITLPKYFPFLLFFENFWL